MTKAEKEEYGPRFCRRIAKGRQCPGAYAKLILTFGDIFALQKIGKGKQLMRKIAEGLKIGDAITPNMEALMRTVLIIGCSHDWPKYLNSETYQNWSKDKAKTPDIDLCFPENAEHDDVENGASGNKNNNDNGASGDKNNDDNAASGEENDNDGDKGEPNANPDDEAADGLEIEEQIAGEQEAEEKDSDDDDAKEKKTLKKPKDL